MAQTNKSMALAGRCDTGRRDGGLLVEFADLFATLKHMFNGYHPERHYMRGPGPAWYAKHAAGM